MLIVIKMERNVNNVFIRMFWLGMFVCHQLSILSQEEKEIKVMGAIVSR